MERKLTIAALGSGVASSLLFIAFLLAGLGIPFLLMPSFPLFMVGLRYGARPMVYAVAAGGIAATLLSGLTGGAFFLGFIAFPSLLLAVALLHHRGEEWPPVGPAIADVIIYAGLALLGLTLHYQGTEGGLPAIIGSGIRQSFADSPPNMQLAVDMVAGQLQFFLIAVSIWCWALLLYAHAWLAQWALKQGGHTLRPSLSLAPFPLHPGWLVALGLAAGCSLADDPTMTFLGQSLFITFLLPYFLLGITIIHSQVKAWPNRLLLLCVLYLFTLMLFWPALLIAGMGVWRQLKGVRRGHWH